MEVLEQTDLTEQPSESFSEPVKDRQTELLKQILATEKKQLRFGRLRFLLSLVGVCIALIALTSLFFGMAYLRTQMESVVEMLTKTVTEVNAVVEELNQVDFKALEEQYSTFAQTGTETLLQLEDGLSGLKDVMDGAQQAFDTLNSVDIESLNAGIARLNEVLEPLANFFARFGR